MSRQTAYKWLARFDAEGDGLTDLAFHPDPVPDAYRVHPETRRPVGSR